jgi:hypothetical protein
MQQRTSNWKHTDGHEATVAALTVALDGSVSLLVEENINIYDSSDFKVGVTRCEHEPAAQGFFSTVGADEAGH